MSAAFGDQLDMADQPGEWFSPYAREYPRISAALELVREQSQSPTVPSPTALMHSGLDYLHSNLPDRGLLEYDASGYDLAAEFIKQRSELDLEALSLEFEQYLIAATESPAPIVVLHSPTAPIFRPEMPEAMGIAEPSIAAWPVPYGYTALRVAYLMSWVYGRCCYWCGEWHNALGRAVDFTLLVSCGSILRLFPTCTNCRIEFDAETGGPDSGVLYFIINDGWLNSVGWPADVHC